MAAGDDGWHEVAWNGIRFRCPKEWDIGELGKRYLLLEDGHGPVFEIRWEGPVKKFSHEKTLKRLGRSRGKKGGGPLTPTAPPPEWEEALRPFTARGFSWQEGATSGRGATLRCPGCGGVMLFQFHRFGKDGDKGRQVKLLSSLSDHGEGGDRLWAVYDIRARLPETLALSAHRFSPGRFELEFAGGGTRLFLHRWSPASVMLADGDLAWFAAKVFGDGILPSDSFVPADVSGQSALAWRGKKGGGLRGWFGKRLGRPPGARHIRIWLPVERNRIFGVRMEGTVDEGLFTRICRNYESL